MSKITQNIYETSGPFLDTITLKGTMPNIISNRPFYSDHGTYFWTLYPHKTAFAVSKGSGGYVLQASINLL